MSPQTIIVVLSVFLVGWYVAGHAWNLRRGRRFRGWLDDGLDVFGGQVEAGWIGTAASGARFNVRRARAPFKKLEITLLLANREIPLLWVVDHLRGKRDRCIIRGTLRSPHRGEVLVHRIRRSKRQGEPWTHQEGPCGLTVSCRGCTGERLVTALTPFVQSYGAHLDRFHWRNQDPHVDIQLSIAGLVEIDAYGCFADLSAALQAGRQV